MLSIFSALALACAPVLGVGSGNGEALRFPLSPDARFSVTYWHSMYDAPVTEDFLVDNGAGRAAAIRLVAIRSDHGGALDYLGLEGQPGEPQPMDRRFPMLSFLVAIKVPQTLNIGTRQWSFREFGNPGERVVLTPGEDCRRR